MSRSLNSMSIVCKRVRSIHRVSLLYIQPEWALAVIYVTRPEFIRTTEVNRSNRSAYYARLVQRQEGFLPPCRRQHPSHLFGDSWRFPLRFRGETSKRRANESEQKCSLMADPPAIRSSLFKGTSNGNSYHGLAETSR